MNVDSRNNQQGALKAGEWDFLTNHAHVIRLGGLGASVSNP
jgi:hypothetical protein